MELHTPSTQHGSRRLKSRGAPLLYAALTAAIIAQPCAGQTQLTIDLQPDLVLGDASGVLFGGLLRVAVNSEGMIYVGDWRNTNVLVFGADGSVVDTIGRRGQGPGEFTAVHGVVVGREDSLYVYDANTARLSVFGPSSASHAFAYIVRPQFGELGRPYRILIPNDDRAGFIGAFRQRASGALSVHRMNHEGVVETRPLLKGMAPESKVNTRKTGNGTEVVRTSPLFGREPILGLTAADEIYYGWTEAIDLTFFDLDGRQQSIWRTSSPPIPVTVDDIEFALRDASEARRRALSGAEHASTKPAVHTVIIDDESRIWTGRYTSDPEVYEWWVTLDHGRGTSAIFSFPSSVEIQVVRGGHAYATSIDDSGAPIVTRYSVQISDPSPSGSGR